MSLRALPLFILLLPSLVYGQAFKGVSAFGAMNPAYPCDQLLSILESAERPAIAVLDKTFGEDMACLSKFVDKFRDREYFIEIHLLNYPGLKNRRRERSDPFWWVTGAELCERLENFDMEVLSYIDSRLEFWALWASSRGFRGHIAISPLLEAPCSPRAYKAAKSVLDKYPQFYTVSHGRRDYDFWEHHSKTQRADFSGIANQDGQLGRDDREFIKRNRRAVALFIWKPGISNGLPNSLKFVPYHRRVFRITPSEQRELSRLMRY